MRRLIIDVAIWLGIEAVAHIALVIAGANQHWRESTLFVAGGIAGTIVWQRWDGKEHDDD